MLRPSLAPAWMQPCTASRGICQVGKMSKIPPPHTHTQGMAWQGMPGTTKAGRPARHLLSAQWQSLKAPTQRSQEELRKSRLFFYWEGGPLSYYFFTGRGSHLVRKLVDALLSQISSLAGWLGGMPDKTVKGLQALPDMLHRNWNCTGEEIFETGGH